MSRRSAHDDRYEDRYEDGHEHRRGGTRQQGGVPDGLLVGVIAFLLTLTVLLWSGTGLAGLFAHGAWPDGVSPGNTPAAVRHMVHSPHDVAGAWPAAPEGQLTGYGLVWGLLIGQLMVLIVLTVFVLGTLARWRVAKEVRRSADSPAGRERAREYDSEERERRAYESGLAQGRKDGAERPGAGPDAAGAPAEPRASRQPGAFTAPAPAPVSAPAPAPAPAAAPVPHQPPPPEDPLPPDPGAPLVAAAATVAAPRTPLVFAGPGERRPLAVQAVRAAEGPVLVVTSDAGLWEETKDARGKLGPVLVHDPGRLCDTPDRLHWSPLSGCRDRTVAAERARALLAPVRPASRIDSAVADTAETLLRCFLHAAAVDDRAVKHLHRWAQGTGVQEAVRVLRGHPKATSGTAGELEAALTAHPERRDMAQELTARALSALSLVHVRESCNANRADTLALESFLDEGGTLYVVGESVEDPKSGPGAMPLLTALVSSVVEHGRGMAARRSSGRLDPPLTLVLDDVAAVAPLPQLPALLESGTDQGLPTLALLRSREQGRSRWPEAELPV